MGEKISVIIPVYNKAEYIKDCVESFKVQTDDNFNIVIIDDGSTDDSPSICRELAESDPKRRPLSACPPSATPCTALKPRKSVNSR